MRIMLLSAFEVVLPTVSDIWENIKYGNYPLCLRLAPASIFTQFNCFLWDN